VTDNTTPYGASEYDLNVRKTIPFYETIHQEAIDLVKTMKPDVACWLDTGCGTGYLVELALAAFPQAQFIVADPAEAMLERARERLANTGGSRLRFLAPVGSEGIVHDDVAPQVITALQCHHYLRPEKRRRAVQACHAVLEDGGLFITFENITPQTDTGTRIGLERWKRYQMRMGRSETVVDNHLERFNVKYFPITANDHVRLLRDVGFRTVEMFWFSQMQAGFYGIK
jgi:tRNA (cmo5U34)-methyltransferase